MNYYKRHLGDYAKNTRTLSTYEHGVYNLVLDLYYTDECPVSTQDAYDVCRAVSEQEMASVDKVLRKFFVPEGEAWRHHRADEEIAKYQEMASKNKANGKRGGRPQTNEQEPKENPVGSQMASEAEPKQNLSHKPLAISQEKEKAITPSASGADAPSAELVVCKTVVDCYHKALPNCLRIGVLNPKRKRRILTADKLARKVCVQQGWDFERQWFWGNYFAECSADPWMRGDVPNPNNPKWKQNLDVLIAEDRFASIMDSVIAAEGGSVECAA